MFFQHAFGNGMFLSFYTKHVIFGLQLGPQLGVKSLPIFVIFASGTQKNDGSPKSPRKPALDASRTLRKPRK